MKKILFCLAVLSLVAFSQGASAAEKPNLNTATQSELSAQPAIGPELAQKLVDYRSDMGDFTGWDDLKGINGMTDAKIQQIKEVFQIIGVEDVDCNC